MTTSLVPRPAKQVPRQECGFCEAGCGQAPGIMASMRLPNAGPGRPCICFSARPLNSAR